MTMPLRLLRPALVAGLLALSACGGGDDLGARLGHAAAVARSGDLRAGTVAGGPFTIAAYHRINQPMAPVTVYVEGDGAAWASRRRLSDDPTPREATGLRLAARDPGANVLYLGRPCQYGGAATDAACHPRLWSSHRFSDEVVTAMDAALDAALARFGGRGVHLTGYSGGGAIAALLAARRDDVLSLRTVAGNLDHAAVNRRHGVSPLSGSLNAIAVAGRLARLPQVHFAGAEDDVVPPAIAQGFAAAAGPCARAAVVPGVSHGLGWAARWPALLAKPLGCP